MLKHKTPSSFSGLATARAEINPTRALPVIARAWLRHCSDPQIFRRPSTKNPGKSPLYKFCLDCSREFLSGGFVRGSFVWKVLSGVAFVRSRSVRIHLLHQKVKHHFKFYVSYV